MAVEGLIYRLVKGSPLLAQEMDNNLRALADAMDALENLWGTVLNPDGSLKDDTVDTDTIIDRNVTIEKLAFLSAFYAVDTGAADALAITFTPALTAYAAGLVFWVKAGHDNTGACTLNVDTVGVQNIKVYTSAGIGDPAAGNIKAGGVYIFAHDGTQFILCNPTPVVTVTPNLGVIEILDNSGLHYDVPATNAATTIAHGLASRPAMVRVVALNVTPEAGYAAGDEVAIEGIGADLAGSGTYQEMDIPAFTVCVDDTNITVAKVSDDGGGAIQGCLFAAKTGGLAGFTPASWKLKVYMIHT